MRVSVFILLFFLCAICYAQTPDYEFITPPIDLMENFYDYMPGSCYATPVQIEVDGSIYIVFQARETGTSTRRTYYAYLDAFGNFNNIGLIGIDDIHEGFAGIDLDPVTGTPFAAWHGNHDPTTADAEVVMSYAYYHQGSPETWRDPFIVFNDAIQTPNMPDDCFIWPEVHIGPSPVPDKRRVYVIGKNMTPSPVTGNPSQNVLIGYADFDENDINMQSELDWTYRTIDLLNQWYNAQDGPRTVLTCSVSNDGKIALTGYISAYENPDSLIVFLNDNFGVGDFEYYSQEAHFAVDNPNLPFPGDYSFGPVYSQNFSAIFKNSSELEFQLNLGLLNSDGTGNNYFFPDQLFPYIFQYDLVEEEFHYKIAHCLINENAANPNYEWEFDQIYLPWDTDNDGEVDEYTTSGDIVMMQGWPIFYSGLDSAFHNSLSKIAANHDNGWLAHIWQDGLKAKLAENGVPGYDEWLEKPEIAICISADNGVSWSKPIFLNALQTPELADMIPCYIYPGDKIEDLGNGRGKLHLFFLDDYSWGSAVHGNGLLNGGMQKYCSLDIDFGSMSATPEMVVSSPQINLSNHPNPFNPSTEIRFQMSEVSDSAEIIIYNIKGQRVKTLHVPPSQSHSVSVVWNGDDENGKQVSSGVYFYQLQIDRKPVASRKMMMIK